MRGINITNRDSLQSFLPGFFEGMGGFGIALDALGGKCIFMSELEGTVTFCFDISAL